MSAERHFDYNDFLPVNFYFDTAIHTVVLPDSIKALRKVPLTDAFSLFLSQETFWKKSGTAYFTEQLLKKQNCPAEGLAMIPIHRV